MCGIVGFLSNEKTTDQSVLLSMRDTLAHRGPDDAGHYIDLENGVGLAHRRLSIIDLSSHGHQPMSNNDGSVWITYNGEVYNFMEVREELEKRGHKFNSSSDTEVLLKAYEEWGIGCVHRLIGMFALALWDRNEKKLYLIRDRAGVKPLYYSRQNGLFLFGSELKALMKHPGFRKKLNLSALNSFLRYGFISSPETIFENVHKLKPGHYLCVSDNKTEEVKYWDVLDFYDKEPLKGTEEEIAEELEKILVDSFKYRLVSDVPVGVFLSGGVDSSLVTALLQKNIGSKLSTFSIGFHEARHNEAEWAKKIADYLGTEHTEYYLSEDDSLGVIEKVPEIFDEPFGDHSCLPTYSVSKLARKDVTVALSADGGDELFCGYNRYLAIQYCNRLLEDYPGWLGKGFMTLVENIGPDSLDVVYRNISFLLPEIRGLRDRYSKWREMIRFGNERNFLEMLRFNLSKWMPEDLNGIIKGYEYNPYSDDTFRESFLRLRNRDPLTQMMAADFKTYLADDILTKVDRASMSVSLEAREPLLDHRIAEFVARVPFELKFKNGERKYILKKVLRKHLPPELFERPKQGFTAPLDKWLKGKLSPIVRDYLNKERLERDDIFNSDIVNHWLGRFYANSSIYAERIWYLLMFQMWKERWL